MTLGNGTEAEIVAVEELGKLMAPNPIKLGFIMRLLREVGLELSVLDIDPESREFAAAEVADAMARAAGGRGWLCCPS